ncbi:MAG: glycoside hydrolase family 28 protein [Lachnospiraceae bacterium]|nr:glycoside hydrolase family 28 protein [Lachnospiraceae bacterium]
MTIEKDRIPFQINVSKPDMEKYDQHSFEIKDYDSAEMSHEDRKQLIQKVVDICKEAGGGTVIVNKGKWISGPIRLYDNICLKLHEEAEIVFSQIPEDYLPVVFTRWEGMECYNYSPLIYAYKCKNIAIIGKGKLNGMGQSWWHWKKHQETAAKELCYAESNGIPVEKRIYGTREAALRPSFIQLMHCENVYLCDFTIEEGPQWTIHPVYCQNVVIQGVNVYTTGHNTDGLNPDSCKDVWIEGCHFSTGDDCIAVNSGMNEDGWRVGRPCENIVIVDCVMEGGHGGVVIGSGMSGGVKNVYASHCRMSNVMQGIRVKSMKGRGGYIKDVWFEDIHLEHISDAGIQISMFYPYSTVMPKNDVPPHISDIKVKNISGSNHHIAIELRGLKEENIKNVELEDIELSSEKSMIVENVEGISLRNVNLSKDIG